MKVIVTHTSPDLDALLSAWLVKKYVLPGAELVFTNAGAPDYDLLEKADAVVDTGKEFAPERLRFDHHQFPGAEANATCAALQVWQHLLEMGSTDAAGHTAAHLNPLVMLVWAGDTGRNSHGADYSREVGLHAQLAARKAAGFSDDYLFFEWARQEFELLSERLLRQAQARDELAEKMSWQSDDGKIVAIEHGEPRHSQAAYAAGATLVVFRSDIPVENGTSHAIGIARNQAAEFPHIGELLDASSIADATEADRWFRHPVGFMAGRGTGKAQRFDAVPDGLTAETVARAIDAAWQR